MIKLKMVNPQVRMAPWKEIKMIKCLIRNLKFYVPDWSRTASPLCPINITLSVGLVYTATKPLFIVGSVC